MGSRETLSGGDPRAQIAQLQAILPAVSVVSCRTGHSGKRKRRRGGGVSAPALKSAARRLTIPKDQARRHQGKRPRSPLTSPRAAPSSCQPPPITAPTAPPQRHPQMSHLRPLLDRWWFQSQASFVQLTLFLLTSFWHQPQILEKLRFFMLVPSPIRSLVFSLVRRY